MTVAEKTAPQAANTTLMAAALPFVES